MSTMPFLYQTRTLASLCLRRSVVHPRPIHRAGTRAFGSSFRRTSDEPYVARQGAATKDDKLQLKELEGDNKEAVDQPHKDSVGPTIEHHYPLIRRVGRVSQTADYHEPLPEGWNSENGYDDNGREGSLVRRSWKSPLFQEEEDLIPTNKFDKSGYADEEDVASGRSDYINDGAFGSAHGRDFEQDSTREIEFDEGEDYYEERDAIDALTSRANPNVPRTSTITPSEKQAFQRIFSDIFARHQGVIRQESASLDLVSEKTELEKPASVEIGKKKLGKLVSDAKDKWTREEMEKTVNRYPVALRAAAARAIGFRLDEADSQSDEERIGEKAMDAKLERLRKPERERVEALMRAAKTDFELWSVMEKEVFSLIPKLGLGDIEDDTATTKPVSKAKAKRKTKKSAVAVAEANNDEIDVEDVEAAVTQPEASEAQTPEAFKEMEDGISALALYGPLYPSNLLLGLRLLDRAFAKPSLLSLSILPKIKSLGLLSHVLGGSTALYNELIAIHWHQRDDFLGVLSLLSEMELSGLEWDDRTLNLVSTIDAMQKATMRGERGEELNALWALPEFAPRKFTSWKEKIRYSLAERNPQPAYARKQWLV